MSNYKTARFMVDARRRRLASFVAKHPPTANETAEVYLNIQQRRATLRARITNFRQQQKVYMPDAYRLLHPTHVVLWNSEAYTPAEGIWLCMPSDIIDVRQRELSCTPGLAAIELDLRQGEVYDAVQRICELSAMRKICSRSHAHGAKMRGRGRRMLGQLAEQIKHALLRKNDAENALKSLE